MSERLTSSATAPTTVGLAFALVITSASSAGASVVTPEVKANVKDEACFVASSNASVQSVSQPVESGRAGRQLSAQLERLHPVNRAWARRLLDALALLEAAPLLVGDISALELECTWCEDGSMLAEIMLPTRRIGFSFELESEKSSWFVASSPPSAMDGAGYVRNGDVLVVLLRAILA